MTQHRHRKPSSSRLAALRESLDVYVSGHSGIQFDALMRFAGPIFDLYDIEWRADQHRDAHRRDVEELSTMVAVLDTARLIWAFLSLDDERNISSLPDLEDALLGRGAGDEERSNLLVLLSLLEEHWQLFTQQERADAVDTPGYALPDFETLVAEYAGRRKPLPRRKPERFGPNDLDLPDALAVFAEPLLRDPDVQSNPDLVEERVERAQAYWDLATLPPIEYDDQLTRIADTYASSDQDRDAIRAEAEQMVARFRSLFPDRGRLR